MQEQLPALLSALVGDAFGAGGWLMGNVAGTGIAIAVQQVQRRRAERARDILLDEVRLGEKVLNAPEMEEAAAVLLRYGRAAQEGAARLNLRLMAKVIAGMVYQQALYADEFLRHADVIAGLRREEVILLGALQRHWTAIDVQALPDDHDRMNEAKRRIVAELIPVPFVDIAELTATEDAVVRTGFLAGTETYGGTIYKPTRAFERLSALVPLEAALEVEDA
jgi:uncharacterized protein with PIN domain